MNKLSHYGKVACLTVILGLAACSLLSPRSPLSPPFFTADGDDVTFYRTVAWNQDAELSRCTGPQSCGRVHFMRGLVGLFESRAIAVQHFQAAIALAPKSHLADSSRVWLQLLRQTTLAEPHSLMVITTKRLVRDMLERDQAARRELNARDRRLEDLESQLKKAELVSDKLEALKRIEEEIKEKSRPMKPATKPVPPAISIE